MATPSSQFHSQLLLLLPVILVVILVAAHEEHQLMPHQGCRRMCGNISIPYPFGIGPGCFRDGFEVLCDDSYNPPRAFLPFNITNMLVQWPLELVSISVATNEARAYAPVAYTCSTNQTATISPLLSAEFYGSPFAVSATRNFLIGVGFKAEPELGFMVNDDYSTCKSEIGSMTMGTVQNGSCTGQGCCEVILPSYGDPRNFILSVKGNNSAGETKLCNYAMLVEKYWYNFSTSDLYGTVLLERFPQGVPFVLDFTAGNTSCPAERQPLPLDYACVSGNSSCANATALGIGSDRYICKCWNHYDGNPYLPNGCQEIDECKLLQNPCSNGGVCKKRIGGYDCPCKFGMKPDGKGGTCTDVFTPAAKATLGKVLSYYRIAL